MRQVKDIREVNIALRELFDFQEKLLNGNFNLNGNRIINLGEGKEPTDAVTLSQLPNLVQKTTFDPHIRTILWNTNGEALTDATDIPEYVYGLELESQPIQAWLKARFPPSTGSLIINFDYYLNEDATPVRLLDDNLELPQDQVNPVFSSKFVSPLPKFASRSWIDPVIINGGEASVVSIGLVVKRLRRSALS